VFQNYALYPHMTVADNMGFALKIAGMKKDQIRSRVEEAAKVLDLSPYLDRKPKALSGGQRQRVAMGRAIVRSPKVFLFDEPLSNLDAALRAELRVELAALVRRFKTTAIYVTHDQVEAMTMGDRIAVLRAGVLQQVGAPRAIYEEPASAFVAGFLGSPPINQIELVREGEQYVAPGISIPAPRGFDRARAIAGVRPERLHVLRSEGGGGAGTLSITAKVVVTEPLGAETYLYLDAAGTALRARAPGFDAPARGEDVRLSLDARAVLWFDAETGDRIHLAGSPEA
jgi:multiple sugar transport system ATP-binding protein